MRKYEFSTNRALTGTNFPWRFQAECREGRVQDGQTYWVMEWAESGYAMTEWGARRRAKAAIKRHKRGEYEAKRETL